MRLFARQQSFRSSTNRILQSFTSRQFKERSGFAAHAAARAGGDPPKGRHPTNPEPGYRLWVDRDLLGLFLQNTANPDQIWKLAILQVEQPGGGYARVDRADSESIALTITGDYGMREPFLKFFFDVNSRQFLGSVASRLLPSTNRALARAFHRTFRRPFHRAPTGCASASQSVPAPMPSMPMMRYELRDGDFV
jgi:hypothetical protein